MISHFCLSVAWLISDVGSPHYLLSPLPGNQALLQKAMTGFGPGSMYYHALSSRLCPWCVFYLVIVCAGSWLLCGFPLVAASGGFSPVAVHRFLIAVASLAVKHGLWGTWPSVAAAPRPWSTGSVVVARVLICSETGVGSPQIRDWACVSCIGRQMLYHCVTREAPQCVLISYLSLTAFLEYFYEQLHEIIFPIFQTLNSLLLPAQMMYYTLKLNMSPVFILKLIFLQEYNCFTMLFVSAVQQSKSAVCIHISPLLKISFSFRSPQVH